MTWTPEEIAVMRRGWKESEERRSRFLARMREWDEALARSKEEGHLSEFLEEEAAKLGAELQGAPEEERPKTPMHAAIRDHDRVGELCRKIRR